MACCLFSLSHFLPVWVPSPCTSSPNPPRPPPPPAPGSGCLVPSQNAHLERAWLLASSRRAPSSQESGGDRKERSVEIDMLGKRVLR